MKNGWLQTICVIATMVLSLVTTSVVGAMWIKDQLHDTQLAILAIEAEQEIVRVRLTTGGWSRSQAQGWVDALRPMATHPIPNLPPVGIEFGRRP